MTRHLTLLNIILSAAVILLFMSLYHSYSSIGTVRVEQIALTDSGTDEDRSSEKIKRLPYASSMRDMSEYSLISEKNLFHPDRKFEDVTSGKSGLVLKERPHIVLYGIIRKEGLRIALVEDKENPRNTPGRGNRHIPLRVGDEVSGYRVAQIRDDAIVLMDEEERYEYRMDEFTSLKHRTDAAKKKADKKDEKKTRKSRAVEKRRFLKRDQASKQNQSGN
jgi:hypothetical protein